MQIGLLWMAREGRRKLRVPKPSEQRRRGLSLLKSYSQGFRLDLRHITVYGSVVRTNVCVTSQR